MSLRLVPRLVAPLRDRPRAALVRAPRRRRARGRAAVLRRAGSRPRARGEARRLRLHDRRRRSAGAGRTSRARRWRSRARGCWRSDRCDAVHLGPVAARSWAIRQPRRQPWPGRDRETGTQTVFELPDGFDAYLGGLSKNQRSNYRRNVNKLGKAFRFEVDVVTRGARPRARVRGVRGDAPGAVEGGRQARPLRRLAGSRASSRATW